MNGGGPVPAAPEKKRGDVGSGRAPHNLNFNLVISQKLANFQKIHKIIKKSKVEKKSFFLND